MSDKTNECDCVEFKSKIDEITNKLEKMDCKDKKGMKCNSGTGVAGGGYGLGFVGAVIYFLQQADSLGTGVIAFLKALVWPAFLVYHLMDYLKI